MNVLILTPDRVGSTLLQRVLTVYMLRREFDKPVINLHELSNGLESYYNTTLNQMTIGRSSERGYDQSLSDIQELLESVDHYKTSRLAHYHLEQRDDPKAEQLKFYNYLNENFYIIKCARKNLFEHALSWIIVAHSKVLNVYSPQDKIDKFSKLYNEKITATKEGLRSKLDAYLRYEQWADRYFNIQSYFNYEDSINDLEKYILNLDFMKQSKDNTWKDMFGIEFNDYNKLHKAIPDMVLNQPEQGINITPTMLLRSNDWDNMKGESWGENIPTDLETANLPQVVKDEIKQRGDLPTVKVSKDTALFLRENLPAYRSTKDEMTSLADNGFMPGDIPHKLQTFNEKKKIIENYTQCIEWYNEWAVENNQEPFNEENFEQLISREETAMNDFALQLENQQK